MRRSEGPKLTDKQEAFCREYLIDLAAAKAARRAGYSKRNADAIASQVLAKPQVKARLAELKAQRATRLELKADKVLEEVCILAHSSVDDFRLLGDRLVAKDGAPPGAMRAISSVKVKKRTWTGADGRTRTEIDREFRLWSKPDALKLSMQHLGLLGDGDDGAKRRLSDDERAERIALLLERARERRAEQLARGDELSAQERDRGPSSSAVRAPVEPGLPGANPPPAPDEGD